MPLGTHGTGPGVREEGMMSERIHIVSDGTPQGTHVTTATGVPIKGVRSAEILPWGYGEGVPMEAVARLTVRATLEIDMKREYHKECPVCGLDGEPYTSADGDMIHVCDTCCEGWIGR